MKGFLLLFTALCVAALLIGFCDTPAQAADTTPMQIMMATSAVSAPVPGGDCAAGVCYTVAATCKSGTCGTVNRTCANNRCLPRARAVVRKVVRVRKWPLIRRLRCCH
jgi:hypothetical protein